MLNRYRLHYYDRNEALNTSGYSIERIPFEEVKKEFDEFPIEKGDYFSLDFKEAPRQVIVIKGIECS